LAASRLATLVSVRCIAGVSSSGLSFCADHLFIETCPGRQTMIGPPWSSHGVAEEVDRELGLAELDGEHQHHVVHGAAC
jgi:hypothetical protein